jgi:2'-5' RNA ligase
MTRSRRLFFALSPDRQTLQAIQSVQRMIPSGKGRRVPDHRLHATLLFLGNQTDARMQRIVEAAAQLEFPICSVFLDHFGSFPRAGVVWLGAFQLPSSLMDFQAQLTRAVESAGIEFDPRPWRMHVTLYRDLRKLPETIRFKPVEWPIRDFQLMESVNSKTGLEYVCRGRWPA